MLAHGPSVSGAHGGTSLRCPSQYSPRPPKTRTNGQLGEAGASPLPDQFGDDDSQGPKTSGERNKVNLEHDALLDGERLHKRKMEPLGFERSIRVNLR